MKTLSDLLDEGRRKLKSLRDETAARIKAEHDRHARAREAAVETFSREFPALAAVGLVTASDSGPWEKLITVKLPGLLPVHCHLHNPAGSEHVAGWQIMSGPRNCGAGPLGVPVYEYDQVLGEVSLAPSPCWHWTADPAEALALAEEGAAAKAGLDAAAASRQVERKRNEDARKSQPPLLTTEERLVVALEDLIADQVEARLGDTWATVPESEVGNG